MRSQRGLESGSKARRAAIGLVPMAVFHALGIRPYGRGWRQTRRPSSYFVVDLQAW